MLFDDEQDLCNKNNVNILPQNPTRLTQRIPISSTERDKVTNTNIRYENDRNNAEWNMVKATDKEKEMVDR